MAEEDFMKEIKEMEKRLFKRLLVPKKYLKESHVVSGRMIMMFGQCVCRECMCLLLFLEKSKVTNEKSISDTAKKI